MESKSSLDLHATAAVFLAWSSAELFRHLVLPGARSALSACTRRQVNKDDHRVGRRSAELCVGSMSAAGIAAAVAVFTESTEMGIVRPLIK